MKKDFYEVLGVGKGSDEKTIKKAYYKMAKKYHPDTNPGNKAAEQKFKEVNEAYDVLSDPEKRKLYDTYGMAAFDGTMNMNAAYDPGGFSEGSPFQGFHFSSQDGPYTRYYYSSSGGSMDDIDIGSVFDELFGGKVHTGRSGYRNSFSNGFGFSNDSGKKGFGRQSKQSRSSDFTVQNMTANITVSKNEASAGCDKVITIRRPKTSKLQIHIPAGIKEGQKIRLKGKGHLARDGMPDGDLFLKVHIA